MKLNKVPYIDEITLIEAANMNEIQDAIIDLEDDQGELSNLTTIHKDTLVSAVNELDSDIGSLSNLETTANSNLVSAINEVHEVVVNTFNQGYEITTPTFTSLPQTFTVNGITADHELVQDGFAYVSNTASCGSDWTITTGTDTVTISGTFVGNTATYVKMSLCVKNKITAS